MKRMAKMLALAMTLTFLFGMTVQASSPDPASIQSAAATVQAVAYVEGISVASAGGTNFVIAPLAQAEMNAAQQAAVAQIGPAASVLKAFYLNPANWDGQPVSVTLNVPGVVAGQKIAVLHCIEATGAWEQVPVTNVSNGQVTATFSSFSPVAVVAYNTSPKTADNGFAGLTALAVLCLAGAMFCMKKQGQF